MTPVVCDRNKYGHCKFGAFCKYTHRNEICQNEACDTFNCEKRHPKKCFWFMKYGRCKFSPCSFKHSKENNNCSEKEIKVLNYRIDKIENSLETMCDKLGKAEKFPFSCEECNHKTSTEKKLRQHIRKNHDKDTDQNETLKDNIIKESLEKIEKLEKFVVRLQEKIEIMEYDKDYKWEDDGTLESIIKRNSIVAVCSKCGYEAKNKAILRKHISEEHHKDEEYELTRTRLKDSEIEELSESEKSYILAGPDTPQRTSLQSSLWRKRRTLMTHKS